MKKMTSLMLALGFSATVLLGEAITSTRASDLCCMDLADCHGDACCSGPGSVDGCIIECRDGSVIQCEEGAGEGEVQ